MDEDRFISARENPRILGGFGNGTINGNKAISGEVAVQKPLPSILDRFKAMLKEREAEMRVLPDDDVPPPSMEEIVRLYELLLSELTVNSKPIITDLTIIAGEQREHAEGIADAICARILEVSVEQKLPSFYLLDSIVKNIGREYVRYFSSCLPEVFCVAYRQVHPNLHPAMRHLFGTWSTVFPPSVLHKIEARLQFSPPANHQSSLRASESPRPTHGIHVNPKYLEARRQLEHSTADMNNHHARGNPSTLKMYGPKPASVYDGYDSDSAEVVLAQGEAQRLSSIGRASFTLGHEKLLPSSSDRLAKPSSPFRIEHARSLSPPGDEVVGRVSPSHPVFEHGLGKMTGKEELSSDWSRTQRSDSNYRRFETFPGFINGPELQRPRALIDAYGNDQRRQTPNNKSLRVDINGIDNMIGTKTWQNTEEEEFDWEDMSPTIPPLENFRTRHAFGTHNAAPLDSDFRTNNFSNQAQNSVVNDPSIIVEDAFFPVSSGRGLSGDTKPFLASHNRHEARSLLHYLDHSSQYLRNSEASARNFQIPPPSGRDQKPVINSLPDSDVPFRGSSSAAANIDSRPGAWPPVDMRQFHPLHMPPHLPPQRRMNSKFDPMNASNQLFNQGLCNSSLPELQIHNTENKPQMKVSSSTSHLAFPNPFNPMKPEQGTSLHQHLHSPQEVRPNSVLPAAVSMQFMVPPLTHGYFPMGHHTGISNVQPNPISGVNSLAHIRNTASSSMHSHGPPLPRGPRPATSQILPISENLVPTPLNPPSGSEISVLVNSLMAQGVISWNNQIPVQEPVGLEFNPDILKVRHEFAITALYSDLPRQCKTCGLRFKCQEEHSSHMDWHVTRNRNSKNRKQKPSRKWFVSVSMWLTGAEALGTDAVPGFLPNESVVEKKDDEEFSVPADEDQNVCALCGEHFDDFYSDETEEWMYKGAVYMNAPNGSTTGMDRSQLGPIVHAKCRSDSNVVSLEDFGLDEGGRTEEGSQRKRLRS